MEKKKVVGISHYKNQMNAHLFVDKGEINTQPSMTIPDQSMSVEELLYRYTHGQSLGGGRTAVYDSDSEIEYPANWDKLDISEKHEFFMEKTKELKDLREKLLHEKNAIIEKKKQDDIDAAVKSKLEKIRALRKGEAPEPTERKQGELPLE